MKVEPKDLSASIHARLKNIAKDRNLPFNVIFQYYAFERFLFRLSKSKHSQEFILKGGLMFFGWGLPLRRFTQDIDLQGFTDNTLDFLLQIFKNVCAYPCETDGMFFDPESVKGQVIMPESEYGGVGLSLCGYLGKSSVVIKIDVGFADEITPSEILVDYPVLLSELGMSQFQIQGYPHEVSIAQKFQTMVHMDMVNSRLKDYYDIWVLSRYLSFDGLNLLNAILSTFESRDTLIPSVVPPALSDDYIEEKKTEWYRKFSKNPQVPIDFRQVVEDLHSFLLPPMFAASKDEPFDMVWSPESGWSKK